MDYARLAVHVSLDAVVSEMLDGAFLVYSRIVATLMIHVAYITPILNVSIMPRNTQITIEPLKSGRLQYRRPGGALRGRHHILWPDLRRLWELFLVIYFL